MINIIDDYFEWLYDWMTRDRYFGEISYRRLLEYLHSIEFRYYIPNDSNRAEDGKDLRYRYALIQGYSDIPIELDGPCSVFEMMVALAVRCEETIMDDPAYGNRTGQWFWGMIRNLGLYMMTDKVFDEEHVDYVINRFLNRNYEPDGKGGLFRIRNCDRDLRDVEIWSQLCMFINNIT